MHMPVACHFFLSSPLKALLPVIGLCMTSSHTYRQEPQQAFMLDYCEPFFQFLYNNCFLFDPGSQMVQQVRRSHAYSKKPPVTIDDLPVPQGSWKAHYDKQNTKYNIQLLVGTVSLAATIGYLAVSDVFIWNFFPPTLPKK